MPSIDERQQRYAEALITEGCAPGSSIHSWRCEYPDMYGPCDCVAETARAVMAVADAEQAELRAEVEAPRVEAAVRPCPSRARAHLRPSIEGDALLSCCLLAGHAGRHEFRMTWTDTGAEATEGAAR